LPISSGQGPLRPRFLAVFLHFAAVFSIYGFCLAWGAFFAGGRASLFAPLLRSGVTLGLFLHDFDGGVVAVAKYYAV
jgi:hypothetical protein